MSEHAPLVSGPHGPAHGWGAARTAFVNHQLPGQQSEHAPLLSPHGPPGSARGWGAARTAFGNHQLPGQSPKLAATMPSLGSSQPSTFWGSPRGFQSSTPGGSSFYMPQSLEDVHTETAQLLAATEMEGRKRVMWMRLITMAVDFVSVFVLIASFPDRGHSVYYYPRPGQGCHNIWCWLALLVIADVIYLLILLLQSINKSKLLEATAVMQVAVRGPQAVRESARENFDELKTWDRILGGEEQRFGASQAVLVLRIGISVLGLLLVWLPNFWFDVAQDGECHPWLFFMARIIATTYSILLFGFLAVYCCYKATDKYTVKRLRDLESRVESEWNRPDRS